MRFWSRIGSAAAATLLLLALTGCPQGPAFEIWLFNTSNNGEMVLITISSEETEETVNVTISVPPNSAQIISDIDAAPFLGDEFRIGVRGDFGTGEGDRTFVLTIEEELEADATYPIVVTGNSPISMIAEYLPLSEGSKGLLQLRKDLMLKPAS